MKSISHADYGQLVYEVISKEVHACFAGDDLYISGKLTTKADKHTTGNGDGFFDSKVTLFDVSRNTVE